MSNGEIELLESLRQRDKRQWWCAVLLSILISGIISFFWNMSVMAELSRLEQLIRENKCRCVAVDPVKQIHEQHVTLQPGWGREDTIREGLKRQWDKDNDVQRMEHAKSSD